MQDMLDGKKLLIEKSRVRTRYQQKWLWLQREMCTRCLSVSRVPRTKYPSPGNVWRDLFGSSPGGWKVKTMFLIAAQELVTIFSGHHMAREKTCTPDQNHPSPLEQLGMEAHDPTSWPHSILITSTHQRHMNLEIKFSVHELRGIQFDCSNHKGSLKMLCMSLGRGGDYRGRG